MSRLFVRLLLEDRSPVKLSIMPRDTYHEAFAGFRIMRGLLEAEGMARDDAETWARVAVGAFRAAVARELPVHLAFARFFSEDQAGRYLEVHRGLS